MLFSIFVLSYITGGYHIERVTDEKKGVMEKLLPKIQNSMESQGFNGTLRNGTIDEWWTQVVNGQNHAIKMSYESVGNSVCILLHEPIQHNNYKIENVGLCAFDDEFPF